MCVCVLFKLLYSSSGAKGRVCVLEGYPIGPRLGYYMYTWPRLAGLGLSQKARACGEDAARPERLSGALPVRQPLAGGFSTSAYINSNLMVPDMPK